MKKNADKPLVPIGKDEMNLAEFPICTLNRLDKREIIEYIREFRHPDGKVEHQQWSVRGAAGLGLPTEFADRVLVALISLAAESGFKDRKQEFTVYSILKTLGLKRNQNSYKRVEKALGQLQGVTISSEGAFWDKKKKRRLNRAVSVIDSLWLDYLEDDGVTREEEGASYIVWGDFMWSNFQAGYIKSIDRHYYFEVLEKPVARVLYRFLDKRMHYNKTGQYSMTVWALAPALNMATQKYASGYKRMLKPALDELIETGFLTAYKFEKNWVHFYKFNPPVETQLSLVEDEEEQPTKMAKPKKPSKESPADATLLTVNGTQMTLSDMWQICLDELKLQVPSATFESWVNGARAMDYDAGTLTIELPNAHALDWVEQQLKSMIERTVSSLLTARTTLVLTTTQDSAIATTTQSEQGANHDD